MEMLFKDILRSNRPVESDLYRLLSFLIYNEFVALLYSCYYHCLRN